MSEKQLREDVIVPLLENTPKVQQVTDVHGTEERGLDVVFVEVTDVRQSVYGMQIKTGDIRGGGSSDRTVKQILDQLELATEFAHPVAVNPSGRKSIDRCIVATNGSISNTARTEIADRLRPIRVDFWDQHELIRRIREYYPEIASGADSETLAYLTSLRTELDSLNALDQVTGIAKRTLSEVFVEPRVQRRIDPTIGPGERSKSAGRSIDGLSLLQEAESAVLLGDQNAGKTSLMRMLGLNLIDVLLEREGDNRASKATIPLYIRAQSITKRGSVPEAATEVLTSVGASTRASAVTEELVAGTYTVFIDGFSELLSEEGKRKCEAAITSFHESYPDNTLLVAARPDDFLEPNYFDDFRHYNIQRFDTAKVRSLIRRWTQDSVDLPDVAQRMVGRVRDALQLPGSPIPAVIGVMLYETENRFITNTAEAVDRYMVIRLGRYAQEMGVRQEIEWTRKEDLLAEVAMEMVAEGIDAIPSEDLIARFNQIFERRGEDPRGRIALKELEDAGVLRKSNDGYEFHRTAFKDFFAAKDLVNRWPRIEEFFVENLFDRKWSQVLVFAAGLTRHNSSLLRQLSSRVHEAKPHSPESQEVGEYVYGAYVLGRILSNSDAADEGPRMTALRACLDGTCAAIPEFEKTAVEQFGNIGELAALIGIEQTFFVTVGVPWLKEQFQSYLLNTDLPDEERYLLTSVYANLGFDGWIERLVEASKEVTSTRALVALQILFDRLAEERSLRDSKRESFLSARNSLARRLEKRKDAVKELLKVRNKLLEIERRRLKRLQSDE